MLLNEISTQQLVKEAEEVAKELAKRGAFGREGNTKLTTQLRKIYDYLLKIKREVEKGSSDEKIKEKLYLIRPKIAYAVSRSKERNLFRRRWNHGYTNLENRKGILRNLSNLWKASFHFINMKHQNKIRRL